VERDSRQHVSSPSAELDDAEYYGFVTLWGDASLADAQLPSRYGILGGHSAIELLRQPGHWLAKLPIVRERKREHILHRIRQAHAMNRAAFMRDLKKACARLA
jgi:hypothetical protein